MQREEESVGSGVDSIMTYNMAGGEQENVDWSAITWSIWTARLPPKESPFTERVAQFILLGQSNDWWTGN